MWISKSKMELLESYRTLANSQRKLIEAQKQLIEAYQIKDARLEMAVEDFKRTYWVKENQNA